ncbi:hypothetical protein [Streptomyces decoyicus]|uniref:hypothetical protein n=1 Tax=Streptomyces decoyicus TaxID=249567 RepID=UPI00386D340F
MPEPEIDAVVFDVLGTLVDESAGIRAGIRALDPPASSDRFDLYADGPADLAGQLGTAHGLSG